MWKTCIVYGARKQIFIFGALGYFKLGALLESLRWLMPYALSLHVLIMFIEQVVPIHRRIILFWIPLVSLFNEKGSLPYGSLPEEFDISYMIMISKQ